MGWFSNFFSRFFDTSYNLKVDNTVYGVGNWNVVESGVVGGGVYFNKEAHPMIKDFRTVIVPRGVKRTNQREVPPQATEDDNTIFIQPGDMTGDAGGVLNEMLKLADTPEEVEMVKDMAPDFQYYLDQTGTGATPYLPLLSFRTRYTHADDIVLVAAHTEEELHGVEDKYTYSRDFAIYGYVIDTENLYLMYSDGEFHDQHMPNNIRDILVDYEVFDETEILYTDTNIPKWTILKTFTRFPVNGMNAIIIPHLSMLVNPATGNIWVEDIIKYAGNGTVGSTVISVTGDKLPNVACSMLLDMTYTRSDGSVFHGYTVIRGKDRDSAIVTTLMPWYGLDVIGSTDYTKRADLVKDINNEEQKKLSGVVGDKYEAYAGMSELGENIIMDYRRYTWLIHELKYASRYTYYKDYPGTLQFIQNEKWLTVKSEMESDVGITMVGVLDWQWEHYLQINLIPKESDRFEVQLLNSVILNCREDYAHFQNALARGGEYLQNTLLKKYTQLLMVKRRAMSPEESETFGRYFLTGYDSEELDEDGEEIDNNAEKAEADSAYLEMMDAFSLVLGAKKESDDYNYMILGR